jgi:hypothetical protein
LTPRRIEAFFATLSAELGGRATIYLTGAAAAALWGRVRPSVDIDFGLVLPIGSKKTWDEAHDAVVRTSRLTGIPASVAADIDRWGMISLLDYKRSSRARFRFGPVTVRLLHPVNWSIGKLTRFLDPDIRDVTEVFRRQHVPARSAARTWGQALRASPASTSQFQFRRNVEIFFEREGSRVWGKSFDATAAIRWFHAAANIVALGTRASPGDRDRAS